MTQILPERRPLPEVETEIRVYTIKPAEFVWAVQVTTRRRYDSPLCVSGWAKSYRKARMDAAEFCDMLKKSAGKPVERADVGSGDGGRPKPKRRELV